MTTILDCTPLREINQYGKLIISTEGSSIIIDVKNCTFMQNATTFYMEWTTLYIGVSFIQIHLDNILSIGVINDHVYVQVKSF